ncbi:serine/threonine-protein kinase [Comamonas sp. JC664]|uniref:serine/threonine-protein kinase n=1 Tax=Comamonas sp. JC664 TaxID=2801917 RepID=UPI0017488504|nr:serine/threonine-protein kinase [Comamonas sp. JC664]MBL0695016.1 serine/threonine protein kinase [Comamonas sp. JC664]GHH02658.1 hypothetical protein GCM10012319_71130 [Comamonas sp. KCTC 72670]
MLAAGTRVGEYVVGRRVAVGGTSDVYSGRHFTDGTQVAVKVLSPACCIQMDLVARFLNEAHVLRRLNHPGIVRAFDAGVLPEGGPYMVLEWLPMDLEQTLVREGGPLPVREGASVLAQLAAALGALHEQGVVHRDLKPANVLVARKDAEGIEVKLADLGLAKHQVPEGAAPVTLPVSTAGAALLGSLDYMAPEQWLDSKHVDARVDVYALGVLGFQLLAGRLPFAEGSETELMIRHLRMPPPMHLLGAEVPGALRSLVERMMAKRAAARPSLDEVRACVSSPVLR